ncbi:acylphosphatase [Persephonella atlantica]|uniref:acylphosphatase n=1 Tax=Persephonella atlantica TaxID=2699429 RepID=A0ABS1GJ55_9AQUI|nr:acylphosphatase [Persephonella atlantica]MBK3332880.1 acylphosphatase [Persephonella atlantica]
MRLYAIFAGTVQGVGFRYFVRDKAKKLGVKGYVRNLPDGTVEVVAEADEETLKKFFSEIEKGPPLAEVTDIRYQFEDKDGGFADFEILY